MTRLAGDDAYYRLELIDRNTGQPSGIGFDLISVTSAIKAVMSGSFGPAAWYGYRVAAGAVLGSADIYGDDVEELYGRLKETKIHPNSVRDAAGKRGNRAHKLMERVGKGEGAFVWTEGSSPEPVAYVPMGLQQNPEELDGYGKAGARWWKDRMMGDSPAKILAVEEALVSLHWQAGGTPDLIREVDGVVEIADWKTHKPASPQSKPAYFEELIQLSAYRQMYAEMNDLRASKIKQRVVILRENGTYLEDTRTVGEWTFGDILALLQVMERAEK